MTVESSDEETALDVGNGPKYQGPLSSPPGRRVTTKSDSCSGPWLAGSDPSSNESPRWVADLWPEISRSFSVVSDPDFGRDGDEIFVRVAGE